MEKLEIIRGDDVSIDFTYKDGDGDAIDITDYVIFLTAKVEVDDDATDAEAIISIKVTSHSDPTNGLSIIPLTADDTNVSPNSYLTDIQVIDDSDNIASSGQFIIEIIGDITRRIT